MPRPEDYPQLAPEEVRAIVEQRLRAELAALVQSEVEADLIEATIAELERMGRTEEAEARRQHVQERRALIAAVRAHIQQQLQELRRGPQGSSGAKAP